MANTARSTTYALRRSRCRNRIPTYVGSFSKPSIETRRAVGMRIDRGAVGRGAELRWVEAGFRSLHETCAKHGKKPGRLMCSYFIHFSDDKAQEDAARARQIRYYRECVIPALPGRSEDGARAIVISLRWWSGLARSGPRI